MCDQDHIDKFNRRAALTRRQFGAMAGGASLAMMLPAVANAQAVTESDVMIETPDGMADAYFVRPSSGAHAAVLVWPDILSVRPAFRAMGKRLAESGYSVLVVNPFYRQAKAPVVPEGASFSDPSVSGVVFPLMRALTPDTHTTDAKAFVAWLDSQAAVDKNRKIGTTGYCMGGPIVMRTAAAVPDRIGAAGTFHGGGLVANGPTSPHLLIPQMKAQFLIAIAQDDDASAPQAKETLREAFAAADLQAEIEVYPADHGWCPPDMQPYDMEQAERAWSRMLALFERALA
jgi:carboxymethylenebutenolidase